MDEEEDEELYADNRPKWQGRGGKKHRNKKARKEQEQDEVDWDAIYDPAKPTNIARYQGSTEQDAERAEWTDFVHYHRHLAGKNAKAEKVAEKSKPRNRMSLRFRQLEYADKLKAMFAPPSGLSFAPPTFDDASHPAADPMDIDDEYYPPPAPVEQPGLGNRASMPSFAPATVPDDATGEDAYMRRMRMSGAPPQAQQPPSRPTSAQGPPVAPSPSAPPPPAGATPPIIDMAAKVAEAQARLAAAKAKIEAARMQSGKATAPSSTPPTQVSPSLPPPPPAEPSNTTSTISKAPVRYELGDEQVDALLDREEKSAQPEPPSHSQSPAPDQPRSKMPGQKGFGERMMAKMGWEKGQGLGAKGEGITTALVAQASKRKKRSDQDGGGWAAPRNMGKIVGGKKRNVQSTDDDEGQFGTISNVVKLQGMLDDLDVTYEIEEKNLLQEIGEEFSKNYGAIERLFIWRDQNGGNNEVFVKFTNQLSALKAVNGTDAMTFAGNPVVARFFNAEKFEAGEYA